MNKNWGLTSKLEKQFIATCLINFLDPRAIEITCGGLFDGRARVWADDQEAAEQLFEIVFLYYAGENLKEKILCWRIQPELYIKDINGEKKYNIYARFFTIPLYEGAE